MMDSGDGNNGYTPGGEGLREQAARAAFLRCLCRELRQQNTELLTATGNHCDTGDMEGLRQALCRVRQSARSQQELLCLLENMLRIF